MLSENRDNFKSSFLVWISFISFSCLISVARISSSTMLNRRGESRHSFLVPDLRRKPFHFPIDYDVSCGLFKCTPCCIVQNSYTNFVEIFFISEC